MTKLKKWQSGNVVLIIALSLIAIVAIASLAVDLGRSQFTQSRLKDVCDTAALAGALKIRAPLSEGQDRETVIREEATKVFLANLPGDITPVPTPVFTILLDPAVEESVRCTVDFEVENFFAKVGGNPTSVVGVSSKAEITPNVSLEVAFALDISESANAPSASKVEEYGTALTAIFDQAFYPPQLSLNPDTLTPQDQAVVKQALKRRFSIVPFASLVNIGTQNAFMATAPNPVSNIDPGPFSGCVAHSNELHLTSERKLEGLGQIVPKGRLFNIGRVAGQSGACLPPPGVSEADFFDMNDCNYQSFGQYRPNMSADNVCPLDLPIQPMRRIRADEIPPGSDPSIPADLNNFINSLSASKPRSSTSIKEGIIWAARTLSPNWDIKPPPGMSQNIAPNAWGFKKGIIMISDGNNNSSFIRDNEGEFGFLTICEQIRKLPYDIDIFAIGYQTDAFGRGLLQQCAGPGATNPITDPNVYYFEATNTVGLIAALQNVIDRFYGIRLTE